MHDGENIMVIFFSIWVLEKQLLRKKFNKNIQLLRFLFLIPLDLQDQMKLMVLIIILLNHQKFEKLISEKNFMNTLKFLTIIMVL